MEMINVGFDFLIDSEVAALPVCNPWDGKRCPSWCGCNVTYQPCN